MQFAAQIFIFKRTVLLRKIKNCVMDSEMTSRFMKYRREQPSDFAIYEISKKAGICLRDLWNTEENRQLSMQFTKYRRAQASDFAIIKNVNYYRI